MNTANEWIRGLFILFPGVALVTRGFGFQSNKARMMATIAIGAVLWVAQYLTIPANEHPIMLFVYFFGVLVTGLLCFSVRQLQTWLRSFADA